MNNPNSFAPRRTSHKKTTPRTKLLKHVKRGFKRSRKREYKNEYIQTLAEFVDALEPVITVSIIAAIYKLALAGQPSRET